MLLKAEARKRAGQGLILLGGIALGARAMYMLDPEKGRRRRAVTRDKLRWALRRAESALEAGLADLRSRVQGAAIETLKTVIPEQPDDDVITARVMSRLGRVTSHMGALTVTSENGVVTLHGDVLVEERNAIVWAARATRGVRKLELQISLHETSEKIPGLQGESRPRAPFELAREEWAPATRLLVGMAGGALAAAGAYKRGFTGLGMGALGMGLIARSAVNHHIATVPGFIENRRDAIHMQKTLTIHAPVDEVFMWLSDPQQFPAIMSHIHDVRKLEDKRYRWTLLGPLRVPISWEAEIVALEPNRLLAWRSVPGALMENSGEVRFEAQADGATRVAVRFRYRPPGGVVAHAIAEILGSDPKSVLDDDMARLKTLLERGKTRAHGKVVCISKHRVAPLDEDLDGTELKAAVNGDLAP